MNIVELGTGFFSWDGHERRSDRYGFVAVLPEHKRYIDVGEASFIDFEEAKKYLGVRCKLKGTVVFNRTSKHIGDLFRKIFPSTPPPVGMEFTLGQGRFTCLSWTDGGAQVGVVPEDGRDRDWLDPHILYQLHSQEVRLFIEIDKEQL